MLLQSAAFGGVFAGFGIARDFERGFAKRLLVSAPQRGGIILGYGLAALIRWLMIAVVLTIVALVAGMQVGGNGVDLFGLFGSRSSSTRSASSGRAASPCASARSRPGR